MGFLNYLEQKNIKLWPVQQVVAKLYFGIPLDEKKKFDVVTDWSSGTTSKFTESTYLDYLFADGRTNASGWGSDKFVLCAGRRSGLSSLGGMIVSYLYEKSIEEGKIKHFLICGVNFESSKHTRSEIDGLLVSDNYIKTSSKIEHPNGSSVQVMSLSQGRLILGSRYDTVFMDNLVQSDDPVKHEDFCDYFSMRSNLVTMTNSILLGSKEDFFYKMMTQQNNSIHLQIPTWEMNPSISSSILWGEFKKDSIAFRCNFGAELINSKGQPIHTLSDDN